LAVFLTNNNLTFFYISYINHPILFIVTLTLNNETAISSKTSVNFRFDIERYPVDSAMKYSWRLGLNLYAWVYGLELLITIPTDDPGSRSEVFITRASVNPS